MLKSLFAALALMASPVAAQINQNDFPAPAVGEFGPATAVDDGLPLSSLVGGDGNTTHIEGEGAPDNVGAFRFICMEGQNNADDPIVAPNNKGGAPHTHQWYGNKSGNFASTYTSLRTNGTTTCAGYGNRTAYWKPDMRSGNKVLRAEYEVIYYKRYPKNSPQCTPGSPQYVGECMGIPNRLKMIFGYDFITGKSPTGAVQFKCVFNSNNRANYVSDMVTAASYCQPGDDFFVLIHAPDCWDGVNLDSANHRDHVSYTDPNSGKCPTTHPKHIPSFTAQSVFKVDANLNRSGTWTPGQNTWYMSCDKMPGMADLRPGTCMHQDYFEAWNPRIKKAWTDHCIDKLLNCSGGDLGNGYGMTPNEPVTFIANPRTVPIPVRRGGSSTSHIHTGM